LKILALSAYSIDRFIAEIRPDIMKIKVCRYLDSSKVFEEWEARNYIKN